MKNKLEIKPFIGLSNLVFGTNMTNAKKIFGKASEIELLDELEDFQSTVWHYWDNGFSLFFDENNNQQFCSVEIENKEADLWGVKIFDLKERQVVQLFKSKNIVNSETEQHDWGEKRLSFLEAGIDFYFVSDKLISINFGKSAVDKSIIFPN